MLNFVSCKILLNTLQDPEEYINNSDPNLKFYYNFIHLIFINSFIQSYPISSNFTINYTILDLSL
jgi:hypothetical protein